MTQLFMLDTDTVGFALRGHGSVGARILEHRPSELCLSAITVAELRYGATCRKSTRLHELVDAFITNMAVLPFDEICAGHFGMLAAELSARGTAIAECDVLIAAHAIAADATLVTKNIKQFARVRGLRVENWA